jgi:hypothetical protein
MRRRFLPDYALERRSERLRGRREIGETMAKGLFMARGRRFLTGMDHSWAGRED